MDTNIIPALDQTRPHPDTEQSGTDAARVRLAELVATPSPVDLSVAECEARLRVTDDLDTIDRVEGHVDRILDALRAVDAPEGPEPETDFAALIAAIPASIDKALREAVPEKYTPQLAALIAADVTTRLTTAHREAEDRRIRRIDAKAALDTLIAKHSVRLEERDTATLAPWLRNRLRAYKTEDDSGTTIIVPLGQDPAQRLHAVRALLAQQGVTA